MHLLQLTLALPSSTLRRTVPFKASRGTGRPVQGRAYGRGFGQGRPAGHCRSRSPARRAASGERNQPTVSGVALTRAGPTALSLLSALVPQALTNLGNRESTHLELARLAPDSYCQARCGIVTDASGLQNLGSCAKFEFELQLNVRFKIEVQIGVKLPKPVGNLSAWVMGCCRAAQARLAAKASAR